MYTPPYGGYYHLEACLARAPSGCLKVSGIDPGLKVVGVAVAEKKGGYWRVTYTGTIASPEIGTRIPRLIAGSCACGIDAPLQQQPPGGFRLAERASLKLGARLLPGWPSMRKLAFLGAAVAALMQEAGVVPVETHPYTASLLAGIPRVEGLGRHEWEAVAAAAAAAAWVDGEALEVEGPDGCLVFPTRRLRLVLP